MASIVKYAIAAAIHGPLCREKFAAVSFSSETISTVPPIGDVPQLLKRVTPCPSGYEESNEKEIVSQKEKPSKKDERSKKDEHEEIAAEEGDERARQDRAWGQDRSVRHGDGERSARSGFERRADR
jgi:hypothetical protein